MPEMSRAKQRDFRRHPVEYDLFQAPSLFILDPKSVLLDARPSPLNHERQFPLPTVCDVPPLPDGWHTVSITALAGSRLALVGTDADLRSAWRGDREQKTTGETGRVAAQASAKLWTFDGDRLTEAVHFPLLEPYPIIDRFPDGRWLVANARSRGHGSTRILRADGVEERRIELGDGIAHIKIDDLHRIWVGWFDEGVFGNETWRLPGLSGPPPSASGIAAFDEWGHLVTQTTSIDIVDCYAMNVVGDTAWACTYRDFPISHIGHEGHRSWSTDLSGARSLAVHFPYVIAAGGYRGAADRVVLLRLDDQRAEHLGDWRIPLVAGSPSDVNLLDGRGDELHVVNGGRWRRWRVSDFVRSLG